MSTIRALGGIRGLGTLPARAVVAAESLRRYCAGDGRWDLTIGAVVLVAIAAIWTIAAERVGYERADVAKDAERQTSNLALALEEHTVRTFKGVEQALAQVAREYRRSGTGIDLQAMVQQGSIDASLFHNIGITDERGEALIMLYDYGIASVAEREYFKVHRDGSAGRTYIGKPIIGRGSGKWTIHVSRRLDRADGSFGGVVFAAMDPHYFTTIYQRSDLGRGGVVFLIGLDDAIARARRAGDAVSFGQNMASSGVLAAQSRVANGSFTSVGRLEGISRILSYRTLAEYRMVVGVGVSREAAFSEAVGRQHMYYLGSILATLFVLLFGGTVIRTLARHRRAAAQLALRDMRQRAIFNQAAVGIAEVTLDGRYVRVNPRFCEMLGYSEQELLALTFRDVTHPDDRASNLAFVKAMFEAPVGLRSPLLEKRYVRKDGQPVWASIAVSVLRDESAQPQFMVGIVQDITERRQNEEQLRLSAKAFDSIADGIIITDARSRVVSVNSAFSAITGYREDELLGKSPRFLQSGRHDAAFYSSMWDEIRRAGHWRGEIWDRRKSGEIYPELLSISSVRDAANCVTHYVGVCTDISSLKRYQAQLHHQARHDLLTGLPNRDLFHERVHESITRAGRHHGQAAVLFLNVDRFKAINESLGHDTGDKLLQAASVRLAESVREGDTVARFGGDEFAILLDTVDDSRGAGVVAGKLLDAMARPFQVGGNEFFMSASIGISCFPQDGADGEALLKNADVAMYRAKAEGRNNYQFFSPDMNAKALENLLLSNRLRLALERDELRVHYQPHYDLKSGQIAGAEALVRWQHPELGMISPARFIPIAEETGLIEPIGEWVLKTACAQMRGWKDAGLSLERIAVNLSARQFRDPELVKRIAGILQDTGLPAHHLELEVTESMVMQNPEATAGVLARLRGMGATIAVDDFGTGYSSLSYLKRFPINFLKIDRSFVSGVQDNEDDAAIVKSIIALARSLKLKLIAEGVETEAQRAFLQGAGCDEGQGYLFSRPLPAAELEALMRRECPARPDAAPVAIAA